MFLEMVGGSEQLEEYRKAIADLGLFEVNSAHPHCPYDGDLFYPDTLSHQYLNRNYKCNAPENQLIPVRDALKKLYKLGKPASYYAIMIMDGDSMGEKVSQCLQQRDPKAAHIAFSQQLAGFSASVEHIVDEQQYGNAVYSGGDDVLALIPLTTVFSAYKALAEKFAECVPDGSASAGIAVVHHTFPLGAALREARTAEHAAKKMPGKDAICFRILKRSGETVQIRSPRKKAEENFETLCKYYQVTDDSADGLLSGRFGYDVLNASHDLAEADEMFESELKRLIKRHKDSQLPNPIPSEYAAQLLDWAKTLPGKSEELAHWLIFARFVMFGGGEE
jgi:CRISPR-associated protein Cmr2